jgi:hypothetical protein
VDGLSQGRPPVALPFPVEPVYRIQPDLRRLAAGAGHLQTDEQWPRYLRQKLELLEADAHSCRVIAGDERLVAEALWEVAGLLAAELPDRFAIAEERLSIAELGLVIGRDGALCNPAPSGQSTGSSLWVDGPTRTRVHEHLARLAPTERLADALALALQEDLVLMAGPPGDDHARLFHVCFPSHWDPAARRGASFAQLHAPVPHNSRLLAGSRNMLAAMLAKGPFERHVWSLTPNPDLDQHPARPHGEPLTAGSQVDRLWFRAERQTTRALSNWALFTIRVFVAPLRSVLDRPGRAELLAASIRSMDAELLSYKGLTDRRDELLEELDGYRAAD